jgi:hypothetical protein
MHRRFGMALSGIATLILLFSSVPAVADSQARIVRLSDVQGSVKIDQATGQGYEKAFLNFPIHQAMKLKTESDSRAEVEFEDGSVIHLTPDTLLEFTNLSLRDSGARVSTINLQQGEAYFSFRGRKGDQFTVIFGQRSVVLTNPVHFRLKFEATSGSLAVFNGAVELENQSGEVEVAKKETANLDFTQNGSPEIAHNIQKEPLDTWDEQQIRYHTLYTAKALRAGYPYAYGLSDLYYYGSFLDIAGYGSCWQPYFTGLGWDPFMDGAWVWDPNFGYMWVSGYPWGWIPYHSGNWIFADTGWCWLQGNQWTNYYVRRPLLRPPGSGPRRPPFGPHRPPLGCGRVVAVGRGPTTSTLLAKNMPRSTMVVKGGDAGLSIPRGMHNLQEVNQAFVQDGHVTLRISPSRASAGNITAMPRVSFVGSSSSAMGHAATGTALSSHTNTASVGSSSQTSSSSHK